MAGLHSNPPGAGSGDRILHRRGGDAARAGDLFITNIAESEFSAHTAVSRSLRIEIQSVGRPNYD